MADSTQPETPAAPASPSAPEAPLHGAHVAGPPERTAEEDERRLAEKKQEAAKKGTKGPRVICRTALTTGEMPGDSLDHLPDEVLEVLVRQGDAERR